MAIARRVTPRAAATAAWVVLAFAAPAEAACEDVFSKIRQRDPLAPLVVGDSVTVPAGRFLGEMGFAVDAVACRTFAQGLEVMAARRLPDLVVVALGSNAAVSGAQLERALELVGPFARLVLVLPKALGGGADRDGRVMQAFETAYPDQVMTLDWPSYSAGRRGWFAPDGLHLTTEGARGFARMIGQAIEFSTPPDEVAPPLEPPRRRPKPRPRERGSPAVAALLGAVARTVASVLEPPIRLLGVLVAGADELGSHDL
jgi:hypothetical protein